MSLSEFFHYLRGVAMLSINLLVHGLHFFGGYLAGRSAKAARSFGQRSSASCRTSGTA